MADFSDNPLLSGPTSQGGSNGQFPDPFLDMASLAMPRSLRDVLDLCERYWLRDGTYRMASSRIVRYFITQIEFENAAENVKEKLQSFLNDTFNATEQLTYVGDDYLAYGCSHSSIVLPFRRYLKCKKCGVQRDIESAEWQFKAWKFMARCANCRKEQEHTHIDRRSAEEDRIRVKRWEPQNMRMLYHPYSGDFEYYWRPPQDFANEIRKGNQFYIKHTPWEMLQTIKEDKIFKFNPGVVYHMREQTLAGVRTGGWGYSRLLSNFAQAWYTRVLKRYNEALALDYVIPFRVLTPNANRSSSQADPLVHTNMSDFSQRINSMLRERRRDPASWHSLPFPVDYQALGGDASQLATPELLDQGMDEMLNGLGIPAELYRGTLNFQVLPTALRLFQQTWPHLTNHMNGWLDWAVEIICTAQNWDKPDSVKLQPVTMADDIERRQIWLQLASANMVSKGTAFAPWNVDASQEQRKIFEEEREFGKLQQEFMEDAEQRQINQDMMSGAGQQAPPGMPAGGGTPMGAPSAGGPGMVTPMDITAQADQIAQQLLAMPYPARRGELINIKHSDSTLHALVKQRMEDSRSAAASQGQQMILGGGGGGMQM